MGLGEIFGKPVSRDIIGKFRGIGLLASGARDPKYNGASTYVTTQQFLVQNGLDSLANLPELDPALLDNAPMPAELRSALGLSDEHDHEEELAGKEEEVIGI
jgi:chromosome segregation and condensation protein ScpB